MRASLPYLHRLREVDRRIDRHAGRQACRQMYGWLDSGAVHGIGARAQREVNQLRHATSRRIEGLPEVRALRPLPPLPVGERLGVCVPPRTLVIVVRDHDDVPGLLEGAPPPGREPGSGGGGSAREVGL